jgi:hypothetical protein
MESILIENLISPITLAFLLGIFATLIRSDLEIPEPVIRILRSSCCSRSDCRAVANWPQPT